jgi:hypothetical protein
MQQDNTNPNNQTPPADTTQANAQPATSEQNKEAVWQKIDLVYSAARKAYLQGSLLPDVIDSFVATLLEIKDAETQQLGGLGGDRRDVTLNESPAEEEVPSQPY